MEFNEENAARFVKGISFIYLDETTENHENETPREVYQLICDRVNEFMTHINLDGVLLPYRGKYPKLIIGDLYPCFSLEGVFTTPEYENARQTLKAWNDFVEDANKSKRGFELVKGAPEGTLLPVRGSEHSAGYDFFAPQDIFIPPHGFSPLVKLNIKAYMQPDEWLFVRIRSSFAIKKDLIVYCSGVIDSDFYGNSDNDGNIAVRFFNGGDVPQKICKGERCCQGIFSKYLVSDNDKNLGQRKGGFGSTGGMN